ncbi:MAG: lysylphosphatidylglycerol synthase transmembrane domain-containing protein [Ignavibacteriota bacterium]
MGWLGWQAPWQSPRAWARSPSRFCRTPGNWFRICCAVLPAPQAFRDRLVELAGQVLLGMHAFHHAGRFLGFTALTVTIWVSDTVGAMIAARGLDLPVSFSMALLLITGLGLGSALPSTPGYVGIYQFVAVTVLVPLGIAKDGALAFILLMQAYGYLMTALLGVPCLWILRSKRAV